MARQPKGEYPSVPETVVDHRPPVSQKPLTASALSLLEFYYKLDTFVMATEEKAPVEWVAERILGVKKKDTHCGSPAAEAAHCGSGASSCGVAP